MCILEVDRVALLVLFDRKLKITLSFLNNRITQGSKLRNILSTNIFSSLRVRKRENVNISFG